MEKWQIATGCAIVVLVLAIASLLSPWYTESCEGSEEYYDMSFYQKNEYSLHSYKKTVDMDLGIYGSGRDTTTEDYWEIEKDRPATVRAFNITFALMIITLLLAIISVVLISLRRVSDFARKHYDLPIFILVVLLIVIPIFFYFAYPDARASDAGEAEGEFDIDVEGNAFWGNAEGTYNYDGGSIAVRYKWNPTWGWFLPLVALPFAIVTYFYAKPQPMIKREEKRKREIGLTTIEKLELLRERLIKGEISEETYKELKEEYSRPPLIEPIPIPEQPSYQPPEEIHAKRETEPVTFEPDKKLKLIKIRCPACEHEMGIEDTGRPLKIVCEKCGAKGTLR